MGAIYFAGTLDELLIHCQDRPRWIIEPFIPAQGIVLLYGKFGCGKSPCGWRIAQSVSEGTEFFGYPVQHAGHVIYIEVDEPLIVSAARLTLMSSPLRNVTFVGANPFSVLRPLPEDFKKFRSLNEMLKPALVIINTLRKIHDRKDIDSDVPSLVYGAWRAHFPTSTLLFIHHDKKSHLTEEGTTASPRDEDFSGSQAWINDAQIGLHLTSIGRKQDRRVRLEVTKSQLGPLEDTLELKLEDDGVTFVETGSTAIRQVYETTDATLPKMERYRLVSEKCHVSPATVRRALQHRESLPQIPKADTKPQA